MFGLHVIGGDWINGPEHHLGGIILVLYALCSPRAHQNRGVPLDGGGDGHLGKKSSRNLVHVGARLLDEAAVDSDSPQLIGARVAIGVSSLDEEGSLLHAHIEHHGAGLHQIVPHGQGRLILLVEPVGHRPDLLQILDSLRMVGFRILKYLVLDLVIRPGQGVHVLLQTEVVIAVDVRPADVVQDQSVIPTPRLVPSRLPAKGWSPGQGHLVVEGPLPLETP